MLIKRGSDFVIYFLAFLLIALPLWVNKYFGEAELDQLIFSIQFGLKGIITSDPIFLKRFFNWCILAPSLMALIFIFFDTQTGKRLKKIFYPFSLRLPIKMLLLGMAIIFFCYQFNVFHFFRVHYFFKPNVDYFKQYYIDPKTISFSKDKPKNLVLIYVESLEATYANSSIFNKNLLAALAPYQTEGIVFKQFQQMFGTGWTIAGMVGSQCGIPLKAVTVFGNNRQGEVLNHFLANATCLSDILAANGYRNIFMKGASLHFGGTRQFLNSHHFNEIYGKEEWLKLGENQKSMSGWGLTDHELFSKAKQKLEKLMQAGQLFNLTLLTVDMHGTEGYLSSYCNNKGFKSFEGVVECTTSDVADFVRFIKERGWLDKISIVITGDHLAMRNPLSLKLESYPMRTVYNLLITSTKYKKRTDEITHFDLFPTILDSLNFNYPGRRLGLGYSAFASENFPATAKIDPEHYRVIAENDSLTYKKLWI